MEQRMTHVIVDADILAKLHGLRAPLVFQDAQGQILGQFWPEGALSREDDLEPGISQEELDYRAEHFEGRPLSELLAEWEKRK
jgi:hypothetical protein